MDSTYEHFGLAVAPLATVTMTKIRGHRVVRTDCTKAVSCNVLHPQGGHLTGEVFSTTQGTAVSWRVLGEGCCRVSSVSTLLITRVLCGKVVVGVAVEYPAAKTDVVEATKTRREHW